MNTEAKLANTPKNAANRIPRFDKLEDHSGSPAIRSIMSSH
jgi:hypothetical protein